MWEEAVHDRGTIYAVWLADTRSKRIKWKMLIKSNDWHEERSLVLFAMNKVGAGASVIGQRTICPIME